MTEKLKPVHPGEVLLVDYDLDVTADTLVSRTEREVRVHAPIWIRSQRENFRS